MSIRQPPDPDDPIEHFIEHLESTDKAVSTVEGYKRSLDKLRTHLSQNGLLPGEATDRECIDFITSLQGELADTTVAHYASDVNKFYQFFSSRGTFKKNPMTVALDEVSLNDTVDPHRREISLEEMREFIAETHRPQTFTMLALLAKTGIRLGELTNLDLYDLHLDHSGAQRVLPEPRTEIADKPDSLFVTSDIEESDVVRGEKRERGNKRERNTVIPLDDELKQVFLYWIAVRPPSPTDTFPLFSIRGGSRTRRLIGERITGGAVGKTVTRRAKRRGWYSKGGGVQNNVTPHYFRHWFETMAERHGLPKPIIKYIRGDVGADITDHYRHFWGSEVREAYTANIYKLFRKS